MANTQPELPLGSLIFPVAEFVLGLTLDILGGNTARALTFCMGCVGAGRGGGNHGLSPENVHNFQIPD